MINHLQLARKLEAIALRRFNRNKAQAIRWLDEKCRVHAVKADDYRRKTLDATNKWHFVYKAYNQARFTLSYYLELDQRFDEEMAEELTSQYWSDEPNL